MKFNINRKNKLENNYDIFTRLIKNLDKEVNYYDLFIDPYFNIIKNKLIPDLLNSKKLYRSITDLLGKDLCFCNDPSLVINLPNKNKIKNNYLFKDWHQEFWSGANHLSIQIWTPIFHSSSKIGQIELIPGSHLWGHIPHSNRKPVSLPKKYHIKETHLEYGDVIVFHPLLLHRSKSLKSSTFIPRLAFPILIKNFRYQNNSFEYLRNWEIFSYSDMSHVERILGNHLLISSLIA